VRTHFIARVAEVEEGGVASEAAVGTPVVAAAVVVGDADAERLAGPHATIAAIPLALQCKALPSA